MASINHHGLPSPIDSALSPTPSVTESVATLGTLPSQRHHPLAPGSPKEIALINYVDDKVLYITRRYATKYTDIKTKAREAPGYTKFEQFIQDLNPLIDLVWATGTSSYMPAFEFTNAMFPLLKRLDMAFSSLLRAHDNTSAARSVVSTTERVRIKSLVDETRVTAVRHGSSAGHEPAEVDDNYDDDDSDVDDLVVEDLLTNQGSNSHVPIDSRHVAMALSKIYESPIVILGDSLTTSTIPLPPDESMDTS